MSDTIKPIPEILYKYVDFDGAEKILYNKTLKATPPDKFNDPFELLARSFTNATPDKVINYWITPSDESYKNIIVNESIKQEIMSFFNDNEAIFEINVSLVKQVSSFFGLTCFTSKNDNILMWSHYAKSHTGVAIGFDSKLLNGKFFRVKYHSERIDIPLEEANKPESICNLISQKALDWKYEDEYRAVVLLNSCDKVSDSYLYSFDKKAIKEIVFGLKILPESHEKLADYVKKEYGDSVVIKNAKLHKTEYKISVS